MVTVALAGAGTGFGQTMLHTFLRLNSQNPNPHHLILLSRSERPDLVARGVDVRVVDYANHDQLVSALKDVHTLLSTVGGSPQALRDSQMALLYAAAEAGVKRFAPSEYAGPTNTGIGYYAGKEEVWLAAKKIPGLQTTKFANGLFLSILGVGTPKPLTEVGEREGRKTGEEEALAGLRPWNFVFNLKAGTADWCGDGSAKVVWTDVRDIATFVYRALALEQWEEVMGMRGDVKTFREVVEIVEKVQGRKLLVKENSVEELEQQMGKVPMLTFYNQARIGLAQGWGMVPDTLNQLFQDVKTMSCEEYVRKWWEGVELGEAQWGENRILGRFDKNEP